MKNWNVILVVTLALGLTSSAVASAKTHADSVFDRPRTEISRERVSWTGVMRCADSTRLGPHDQCEMEFVRDGDLKVFDLQADLELAQAHCTRDVDLRIKVNGEVTPKFLFWGGDLKVAQFTLLNEVPRKVRETDASGERMSQSMYRFF